VIYRFDDNAEVDPDNSCDLMEYIQDNCMNGCGMVSTICCCVNLTYRQAPGVSDETREAKTWIMDPG
jgi:hypothetical protein